MFLITLGKSFFSAAVASLGTLISIWFFHLFGWSYTVATFFTIMLWEIGIGLACVAIGCIWIYFKDRL